MTAASVVRFVGRALLAMLVFAVGGGLAGGVLSYGSTPEDPANPGRGVTVMAVWDGDGGGSCRAFAYRELLAHLDTLPLRFGLRPDDVARCREDFAAYNDGRGWPRQLRADEARYPGYSFEVGEAEPLEVTVRRLSGDPAVWVETRYRVGSDESLSELRTRSASAGQGLGFVLGVVAGLVAWLLWLAWMVVRRVRGRSALHDAG